MCYLPISCLKGIIMIGSMFTIAVSVGILIAAIIANNQKKDIIDNSDKTFVDDSLIAVYVCSILFLLLGMCGLYGACKTRRKHNKIGNCLLGAYFIGVMIFLFLFAAGMIFFFVAPGSILGDRCDVGSKTQLIKNLYDTNQNATETFCQKDCPCYVEDENSDLYKYLKDNSYVVNTDNTTKKNYQSCLGDKDDESSILLLGTLEELLDCGGWCPKDDRMSYFLKFSNINSCVTKQCLNSKSSCYDEFKGFLQDKSTLFGLVSLAAMLVSLVNAITICCLCYHPGKQRGMKNFYKKMLDQNS